MSAPDRVPDEVVALVAEKMGAYGIDIERVEADHPMGFLVSGPERVCSTADLARDLLDARKALCLFLDTTAYDPSRAGETVSLQPCIEAAHAALPGWQVIESRPKE